MDSDWFYMAVYELPSFDDVSNIEYHHENLDVYRGWDYDVVHVYSDGQGAFLLMRKRDDQKAKELFKNFLLDKAQYYINMADRVAVVLSDYEEMRKEKGNG